MSNHLNSSEPSCWPANIPARHPPGQQEPEGWRKLEQISLSPSSQHFLYEMKSSFPFPQPGILITSWTVAKSLPPCLAGADLLYLVLLVAEVQQYLQMLGALLLLQRVGGTRDGWAEGTVVVRLVFLGGLWGQRLVACTALQLHLHCSCSTIFSPPRVKHIAQLKLSLPVFPIYGNESRRSQLLCPLRPTSYLPWGMAQRLQAISRRIFFLF